MRRRFSILHISDLHKGENANLDDLYYSLTADCDAYTSQGIAKPSIIVVSGDLVEGANSDNANEIINKQYHETEIFLNKLIGYFLDGDKRRIVIVPGNHDVNWAISEQSMKVSTNDRSSDFKKWRGGHPLIRWSWKDYCFHIVNDIGLYKNRFSNFVEFYNRFYSGIYSLPLDSEEHASIIDIPSCNVTFVGFNSCCELDHLNSGGKIRPTALTSISEELKFYNKMGRFLIGVWHHHISGLPSENNYLDYRILHAMMDSGIKVGLFGHQHISQVISEYYNLNHKDSMVLISSGSLYGNQEQMPNGQTRQYNVIEFESNEDTVNLSLHVRKDISSLYDIPHWEEGEIATYEKRVYTKSIPIMNRSIDGIASAIYERARINNDYVAACAEYKRIGLDKEIVQKFFDECLKKIDSDDTIIELIEEPHNDAEAIRLMEAVTNKREPHLIKTTIAKEFIANNDNPFIQEMVETSKKYI